MTKPNIEDDAVDEIVHEATETATMKQERAIEITCTITFWPSDGWKEQDYVEMINAKLNSGFPVPADLKILGVQEIMIDQKSDGSYF
jgi:hypothetical protein